MDRAKGAPNPREPLETATARLRELLVRTSAASIISATPADRGQHGALPLSDRLGPCSRISLRGLLAAGMLAAFALLGVPASAHVLLRRSVPLAGTVVPPGPITLTLEFSGRIDRGLSELVLVNPHGEARTLALVGSSAPSAISARSDVQPGSHVLRWTVMSSDGHLTRGTVPFNVSQDR